MVLCLNFFPLEDGPGDRIVPGEVRKQFNGPSKFMIFFGGEG